MSADPPVLSVVRGNPSAEELAALLTVLLARPAGGSGRTGSRAAWSERSALVRPALSHGPGAWRRSGRPS